MDQSSVFPNQHARIREHIRTVLEKLSALKLANDQAERDRTGSVVKLQKPDLSIESDREEGGP